jgi:hypothetical protein
VPNPELAFYSDPKVWSVGLAMLALVLSQLPPLHKLFRRGKLELDVYEKGNITHMLGNPNMQFHLILNNTGGKQVTITSINAKLSRDGKIIDTIQGQNYIKNPESNGQIILTKFKIKPNEEWTHSTNFFNNFSKTDEKQCKSIIKRVRDDISEKLKAKDESSKDLVLTTQELISEMNSFFNKNFIWETGEYTLEISTSCENTKHDLTKSFRFTLFESDSDELKEYETKYKYGESILYNSKTDFGVVIRLSEVNA